MISLGESGVAVQHMAGFADALVPLWLTEDEIACLLYTSDAADDLLCVDLGGRRIIKKKNGRSRN